jgi:salicylate hydroxylase
VFRDPLSAEDLVIGKSKISSRVTLIGDAAHPMSPFKGQGANQALLDAMCLTHMLFTSEITRPSRRPVQAALRDYEQEMCSRSRLKVLKSRSAAKYLHNPCALAVGDITRAAAAEEALVGYDCNIQS